MSQYRMYVRIVGEPFLSRVKDYRAKMDKCVAAWREFANERGAASIPGGLSGLNFSGKAPDGWTKPQRKHGWSRPKDGHPDAAIMAALPQKPSSYDALGDAIIDDLRHEGPNGSWGVGAIGHLFEGPIIGWAGDTYFAVIPDAKKAADDHLAAHPNHKITNGADKWTLPPGLVHISEAEHDLIVAEYKVAREQGRAA